MYYLANPKSQNSKNKVAGCPLCDHPEINFSHYKRCLSDCRQSKIKINNELNRRRCIETNQNQVYYKVPSQKGYHPQTTIEKETADGFLTRMNIKLNSKIIVTPSNQKIWDDRPPHLNNEPKDLYTLALKHNKPTDKHILHSKH